MHNDIYNNNPQLLDAPGDLRETDGDRLVLFPGKIIRRNGALAFEGPLVQFFLTVGMGKAVWRGKIGEYEEVCVGIRERDIRVDGDHIGSDIDISAKIENVQADGPVRCVGVRVGNLNINVLAEKGIILAAGEVVRLHFSRSRALLYRCSINKVNLSAPPLPLAAL